MIGKVLGAFLGGKAAQLGALTRVDGVRVPPGFCVGTHAFRRVVTHAPVVATLRARAVTRDAHGYGSPRKTFSIALGCDIQHAPRLVYAKALNLSAPEAATPIGMGCKVCEREHCAQRAFPFLGRPLVVDENQSRFAPYSAFEGTTGERR